MLNLNRIGQRGLLVLLLALSLNSAGAASEAGALATLAGNGGQVFLDLNPGIQNAGSVLTVAYPDGKVLRREFQAGGAPFIEGPLADGTYSYELTMNPVIDVATRRALRTARQATGGQEALPVVDQLQAQGKLPVDPQVQSGNFTIAGGSLVNPDATE